MALAQSLPMPSSLLSSRPPASQQLRARTSATSEVPSVVLTRFESLSAEQRIRVERPWRRYAAEGVTPASRLDERSCRSSLPAVERSGLREVRRSVRSAPLRRSPARRRRQIAHQEHAVVCPWAGCGCRSPARRWARASEAWVAPPALWMRARPSRMHAPRLGVHLVGYAGGGPCIRLGGARDGECRPLPVHPSS